MATDEVQRGNEAFLDEDFEGAVACYGRALEKDARDYTALQRRAQALGKLGRWAESAADAAAAIALDAAPSVAHQRHAHALFNLDQFSAAKSAATAALARSPAEKDAVQLRLLIRKCLAELEEEAETPTPAPAPAPAPAPQPQPQPAPAPAPAKVRQDWCQSGDTVSVVLYCRGLRREDVTVEIAPTALTVVLRTPAFRMEVPRLFATVVPERSGFEVLSTKVEITLAKDQRGVHWDQLEATATTTAKKVATAPSAATLPPAASGAKPRDWDRVVATAVAAEPEEKPEGDAALQAVFQQIYAGATEEQRRAMIKSYTESGGTVLSTNWEEVGKKKVEGKAPDGQEMHRWDEH